MNEESYNICIEQNVLVTQQDIDDIMTTALEGGITDWCWKAEVIGGYLGEFASEQISRGGTLKLYDSESGEKYLLDKEKLLNGIKKAIADDIYPDYEWRNNGRLDCCQIDADVANAIVQLALFEDIIYG